MLRMRKLVFGRHMLVTVIAVTLLAGTAATTRLRAGSEPDFPRFQPNNFPHLNPSGISTTFSTRGFVDLAGE